MPRQVRIEYAGALYHAMARGDRGEPIFQVDEDRGVFLKTLEEAVQRTGWIVHAFVLMTNGHPFAGDGILATVISGTVC